MGLVDVYGYDTLKGYMYKFDCEYDHQFSYFLYRVKIPQEFPRLRFYRFMSFVLDSLLHTGKEFVETKPVFSAMFKYQFR